jgi:hypothetical protein
VGVFYIMLNINIPHFYCYLRKEQMYQHKTHIGEFDKVLVFGAQSCSGRALTFHVLTDYGLVRSRVPIHMLCHKTDSSVFPLDYLQLWDCFDEKVTVTEFDALTDTRSKIVLKDGSEHWGKYMMTFDWFRNSYSDEPSQYKCLHMFKLDNGNFTLQPNNRIKWKCMSFVTKPFPEKPDYLVDDKAWICEDQSDRWIINSHDSSYYYTIDKVDFEKKNEQHGGSGSS